MTGMITSNKNRQSPELPDLPGIREVGKLTSLMRLTSRENHLDDVHPDRAL